MMAEDATAQQDAREARQAADAAQAAAEAARQAAQQANAEQAGQKLDEAVNQLARADQEALDATRADQLAGRKRGRLEKSLLIRSARKVTADLYQQYGAAWAVSAQAQQGHAGAGR